MIQNVYVDVYFCLNFLMDFVVILVTAIIVHSRKCIFRITVAAMLGALYAVVVLVSGWKGIVSTFCTYIVISLLMVITAFGNKSYRNVIRNVLVLYAVSFSLSGMLNAAYYCTSLGNSIIEKAGENIFGNISISLILCMAVIVVTGAMTLTEKIRRKADMFGNIFLVTVKAGGRIIKVNALRDTGNSLYEPITKKPVSVIDEQCIESIEKEKLRQMFVPYNTVGKVNGLMEAFIADSMEIDGKLTNNTIIGIHKGKLSRNNQYNMILHPDIINDKEN